MLFWQARIRDRHKTLSSVPVSREDEISEKDDDGQDGGQEAENGFFFHNGEFLEVEAEGVKGMVRVGGEDGGAYEDGQGHYGDEPEDEDHQARVP